MTRLAAADFSALKIIQPQTAFDASPRAIHFFSPRKGCNVTMINILNPALHGSLAKEFRELRALERLDLRDTNITGDLDMLKENTELRVLSLQNTRISGNLQSLAKATGLEHLLLRGAQVSGDLVALSYATWWRHLDLAETKVYGDVVALKKAKRLWHLDLAETKVYGDMAGLANLTKLEELYLSNTKVSGDLAMLRWKWIKHLDLSGTKVSGHFNDWYIFLKTLKLAWTEVRILDGILANFFVSSDVVSICPFPALTTLDMTGTSSNTTVEKLLGSFAGCKKLRIFKAAECTLTGEIPYEIGFGQPWSWPLGGVLQLLDLSSNNVTKVEALPHNCRAVSFRDNPQISFGKDVVKEAAHQFVSLDLRNASFAHPSDTRSSKDFSTVFKVGASRPIVCGQSF